MFSVTNIFWFLAHAALSGWTAYSSSPSSFGRSKERKVSGQYRFSGSRFQNSRKDCSYSTKSWQLGQWFFLQRATTNFASVNQIGEGGFGAVFKGKRWRNFCCCQTCKKGGSWKPFSCLGKFLLGKFLQELFGEKLILKICLLLLQALKRLIDDEAFLRPIA